MGLCFLGNVQTILSAGQGARGGVGILTWWCCLREVNWVLVGEQE